MFNTSLPAALAVYLLAATPGLAQDSATHNRQTQITKGASVTIEGCVTAGAKEHTYMLAGVKEIVGLSVETGRKHVFWLNDFDHIRGHDGRTVRIVARVTDLERSEIDIELGVGPKGGAMATIEGPGYREVSVPSANVGIATPTSAQARDSVLITLIKLEVDKVTILRLGCS